MEVFMTEKQLLLTLNYEQFNEILSQENWFNLQREFVTQQVDLSQDFLIWRDESGNTWMLVDFENQKTYDIERKIGAEPERSAIVEISGPLIQEEQLVDLKDAEAILLHLQQSPYGTKTGFINFLKQMDLDEDNLEKLKRSDLSGAGFSFEFVYQDLLTTHKMFREILISSRETLIDLSRDDLRNFANYLHQFYEYAKQINNFEIKGENPSQNYNSFLQTISQFYESTKGYLRQHIAYLSSKKVGQLENQIDTTLAAVEERYNTTISEETDKLLKINKGAQENEEKRQESFDQLYIQLQNQLTEKPISQYKAIFADQAQKHQKSAQFWMGMAALATAAFGGVFVLLSVVLESGGTQLTGILQNIFTKGFVLSPIYVWLNRSLKNHTAQKHLEIINTHRQKALETFDTFVAAAEGNRETRDAVLLAATKAIFDANQSGYLSTKTSGSDNTSPVQQIIKEVIPTKSSDS